MMVSMVKKAGRKVDLPSADELVGIPKALESDSDIIGEADESDTPMTGIEVGDEELNMYKTARTGQRDGLAGRADRREDRRALGRGGGLTLARGINDKLPA